MNNISYAEYIAEHISKNLNYAEYIAGELDKNISYSEYIAEMLNPNIEAIKLRRLRKQKLQKIFNENN